MITSIISTTNTIAINQTVTPILATIGIILLVALLILKELASTAGDRFQLAAKTLNIAIIPLLIAFVLIVVSKVIEVIV